MTVFLVIIMPSSKFLSNLVFVWKPCNYYSNFWHCFFPLLYTKSFKSSSELWLRSCLSIDVTFSCWYLKSNRWFVVRKRFKNNCKFVYSCTICRMSSYLVNLFKNFLCNLLIFSYSEDFQKLQICLQILMFNFLTRFIVDSTRLIKLKSSSLTSWFYLNLSAIC